MQGSAILLLLALLFAGGEASAKSKRYPRELEVNNGKIKGKVSCYSPPKSDKPGCEKTMQGCNKVSRPKHCPGMKPYDNAYQTPKNGLFVVAGSRSFIAKVGYGAIVEVPGVPGAKGIVCDLCPGCDKYGKVIDVASNNPGHRNNCPLTGAGNEIKVVSSKTKQGI